MLPNLTNIGLTVLATVTHVVRAKLVIGRRMQTQQDAPKSRRGRAIVAASGL